MLELGKSTRTTISAMDETTFRRVVFAELAHRYPDLKRHFTTIQEFIRVTGGDPADPEAWNAADCVRETASELLQDCEGHATELSSRDPYDYRMDA